MDSRGAVEKIGAVPVVGRAGIPEAWSGGESHGNRR